MRSKIKRSLCPSIKGFSESTLAAPVSFGENRLEGRIEGIKPFCHEDHKQSMMTAREIFVALDRVVGRPPDACSLVSCKPLLSDISESVSTVNVE